MRILVTGVSGMLGGYFSKATELSITKFSTEQIQLVLLTSDAAAAISNWQFGPAPLIMSYEQFINTNDSGTFNFIFHFGSPSSNSNETLGRQLEDMNSQFLQYLTGHIARDGFLVFISSSEVYGKGEEMELNGNKYGTIKSQAELLLRQKLPDKSLSVRLFHTFGPGLRQDDKRGFAKIIQNSYSGSKVMLSNPGAERHFLSNFDFARAVNILAKKQVVGHIDLAGQYRTSMTEFAKSVGAHIANSENSQFEFPATYPNLDQITNLGWRESLELKENIKQLGTWQSLRWR